MLLVPCCKVRRVVLTEQSVQLEEALPSPCWSCAICAASQRRNWLLETQASALPYVPPLWLAVVPKRGAKFACDLSSFGLAWAALYEGEAIGW